MRYFLEVSYNGTKYAGSQIQDNADTIQAQLEKVITTIVRSPKKLTGSSRTDAGVHALQNFFHFDVDEEFQSKLIYNLNALLPKDIVVKSVIPVPPTAHSRFLASSRQYKYFITTVKNPFLSETAWFYPFSVDINLLNDAAKILYKYTDYTSFSKRSTKASTNICMIMKSEWIFNHPTLIYTVESNRFLRGMVRGLVGTMLLVGRKKITLTDFENIIASRNGLKTNFATPPNGLFLVKVEYPFLDNVLKVGE